MVGTITVNGHAGINRIKVKKVHGRALGPGHYRVSVFTQSGNRSTPAHALSFTVTL